MAGTKQVLEREVVKKSANLRHIVALDANGNPTDECLCGYLWDRVNVKHNGSICQECVDEMRRREA